MGEAPRFGGGSAAAFASPELPVAVSLHPAGTVQWMNDVICGTEVLADFPGAKALEAPNRVWLTTTTVGDFTYFLLRLAEAQPTGAGCEQRFDVAAGGGWAVQASAQIALEGGATAADGLAWLNDEGAQDAIRVLQSIAVKQS